MSTNSSLKEKCEINFIIDSTVGKDSTELFCVRWKGYRSNEDTWEPEQHFNDLAFVSAFCTRKSAGRHITPANCKDGCNTKTPGQCPDDGDNEQMPDTSTCRPVDTLCGGNIHSTSGGSKDSTPKTPTHGAATDTQQPQTLCSQFLGDLTLCEQQLCDNLTQHSLLVSKLQSLRYHTDTSLTQSHRAELMPVHDLMLHPQLN